MSETIDRDYDRRFNARLDRVEGIVETLATNQARVETALQALSNQTTALANSLENFTQQSYTQAKTNWGMVLSAGTLILALIVALGTGFVGQPLSNLQKKVEDHIVRSDTTVSETRNYISEIQTENVKHHSKSDTLHAQYSRDIEYLKNLMHKDEANMTDIRDKATNQEARIANLERLVFPEATYRSGQPN